MKVALVCIALVAVAAAANPYYGGARHGYGQHHVDHAHVPHYKFDWAVKDADYYGQVNDYGQTETRLGDDTRTSWYVKLPGYSHITRDDGIHSHPTGKNY